MSAVTAAITGVHGWLPPDLLTNADLVKMVDTTDEWIQERTGITQRHILKGEGRGTSEMAKEAVLGLLAKTNTLAHEVDMLICATVTPDMVFPSTANIICAKAGLGHIPSFDVTAACSGFLYALEVGRAMIASGAYKKIIVVGADKMSSIIDYSDRATCIIFGDGAGAVLLEPSVDDTGIKDSLLKSDGDGAQYLYMKAGGSNFPASMETVSAKQHFVTQEGKTVFKFAVKNMADISLEVMKRNGLTGDDVSWFVPHQANKRIIDSVASSMGVSLDKVMVNIQKYGNTTAATLPLCLWDWESKLKKGDNIILATFGGGFTWAATYLKWSYDINSK